MNPIDTHFSGIYESIDEEKNNSSVVAPVNNNLCRRYLNNNIDRLIVNNSKKNKNLSKFYNERLRSNSSIFV